MRTLLIQTLILSLFYSTSGQKSKCPSKRAEEADLLVQKLYLFGSPDREYPTNQNEMKKFCNDNNAYKENLKVYSSECLERLSKQVLSLLMYSINKNNQNICKSRKRTLEFLQIGRCGNAAKKETHKCWNTYIDDVNGIKTLDNHKIKIPLMCCSAYRFKACSQRAYEKLSTQCSRKDIDGLERLFDSYTTDTLSLLCGDYKEDNDKCDTIAHLTPKSQEKTAISPISGMIAVFDSMP